MNLVMLRYKKGNGPLQLYNEYQSLCYQYNLPLKKIIIQISRHEATLGTWDSRFRRISLSYKLLLEQPWNIVLEIFKHEIAHQYADEVLLDQGSHGALFLKACDVIRVETLGPKIINKS